MRNSGIEESMSISTTPTSPRSSSQVSPKSRAKFLCSHGGKILPRPTDGLLKYVGGETRVISVPRDVTFRTLMKKLTYLIEGEMILKYQLLPEDLDALVSVKSDEDLRHMFEEHDRHESLGAPRLKTFLFPANPHIVDPTEPQPLEQRYLDAINGVVRSTTTYIKPISSNANANPNQTTYSISSACSSPRSPESCTSEATTTHEALLQLQTNYQNSRISHPTMNKVQSSPNLYSLNPQQHLPPQGSHQVQQQQQQQHHYYQSYKQLPNQNHHHHHHSYQSNKPPLADKYRPPLIRYHHGDQGSQYYYPYPNPKHGKGCCPPAGTVFCNKCRHYDEYTVSNDRPDQSLPPTRAQSPSPGSCFSSVKGWDNGI